MKLSELLEDAPPARYGVDDAVRAGKRLRFRRRSTVVLAAVMAVAAAIGVPQITAHSAGRSPAPVAPAPSVPQYTFRGYDAGELRVSNPYRWTPAQETAYVWLGSDAVGSLRVYHPGVEIEDRGAAKRTPIADIGGRSAYLLEGNGLLRLIFDLAGGAHAEVESSSPKLKRERLSQVAEAFRPVAPYPVTVAMSSEYVPPGYLLVGVSGPEETRVNVNSQAEFAPAAAVQAALNSPSRSLLDVFGKRPDRYFLTLEPIQGATEGVQLVSANAPARGTAGCAVSKPGVPSDPAYCSVDVGQAQRWSLSVMGPDNAEARKMLDATTPVPDLTNRASWLTADQAFPASALAAVR
jgi:hypothetical protein